MTFGNLKRGTALSRMAVIAALGLASTGALASEVSLKSSDGTVNLTGEFVDFVDDNYIIRTALGELRISAARVRCEGAACPTFETATADVKFAGSDTIGSGLMPLLLAGYASSQDAEASVTATANAGEIVATLVGDGGFGDELGSYLVSSTSSGDAFESLLNSEAQLGMSARRITPNEARALRDSGAGNMVSPSQEHIIAADSVVVITNPGNPVDQLTLEQVAGIYSGQISNWSELGGPDAPIKVINRDSETGTYETFYGNIFGGDAQAIAPIGEVAEDNNQMASMVNADENAIGFVGYAFQRGAKPVSLVNSCGIVTTPDAFSAKTEEYQLQRRLYIYTREDTADDATDTFIDYATSADADNVIAKAGFINLGIATQEMSMDSPRAMTLLNAEVDAYEGNIIREKLRMMVNYDRLSTTFRFRTGSSKLDERGRIDMARLTDYLEGMPEGTSIRLVGFTDSVGAFDSNLALSIARAEQVMAELRGFAGDRLANVSFDATGFGEVAPTACNTDDRGKSINRRVEVWIESGSAS
ncbi:MAG: phosphate ABC transporter substrate-binding/OmpA family protein [Pseudomonadota bacterium]